RHGRARRDDQGPGAADRPRPVVADHRPVLPEGRRQHEDRDGVALAARRAGDCLSPTSVRNSPINSAETTAALRRTSMPDLDIVWTKVDEAPGLATFSLLPIVQAFVGAAGVKMKLKDISLTGRILANFPDKLTPAQKINDELAELGKLAMTPE